MPSWSAPGGLSLKWRLGPRQVKLGPATGSCEPVPAVGNPACGWVEAADPIALQPHLQWCPRLPPVSHTPDGAAALAARLAEDPTASSETRQELLDAARTLTAHPSDRGLHGVLSLAGQHVHHMCSGVFSRYADLRAVLLHQPARPDARHAQAASGTIFTAAELDTVTVEICLRPHPLDLTRAVIAECRRRLAVDAPATEDPSAPR
eukprot:gnl/Ergobibamus_cyprinoides/1479.p1 GENE.gnl/Ergobibamus_cyprinoides/1479~~gnl/Ergobibamus_cyprinoides/1479.p1  ORF type:complete len:206 (+),score=14.65 gnl/Ergobibamus_cyprinoides/1479:170-787(+)